MTRETTSDAAVVRMVAVGGEDLSRGLRAVFTGTDEDGVGEIRIPLDSESSDHVVRVRPVAGVPCGELLAGLSGAESGLEAARAIRADEPDVVVLSLSPDLETDAGAFRPTMRDLVRVLRDEIGTHVLVLNASSALPGESTLRTHGRPETDELRIHRLNCDLIELSAQEGISVIDVDRIVCRIGALDHVRGPFRYSSEVDGEIGREIVRVLADYAFFEPRPVVPQMGQEVGR